MNTRVHIPIKTLMEALHKVADFHFSVPDLGEHYHAIMSFRKLSEDVRTLSLSMTMKEIIEEKKKFTHNPVTLELYKAEPDSMARIFMFRKMIAMPGFFDRYFACAGGPPDLDPKDESADTISKS